MSGHHRKIIVLIPFWLWWVASFSVACFAQEPVYVEDQGVYVDAPVVGGDAPAANAFQGPAAEYVDQFHTGFLNLEFLSPLYYQFSGNSIFFVS